MKAYYMIAMILGAYTNIYSQIHKQDSSTFDFQLNVEIGALSSEYSDKNINLDKEIAAQRGLAPANSYFTGKLTDEPYEHGAIYSMLSVKTSISKRYLFYTNLYTEYRGQSYGNRDLNNAVVFPIFYGKLQDSIKIRNYYLLAGLQVGDLLQYRLNQGLQIYNQDVQAVVLDAAYRGIHFSLVHMPDVSKSIGLGLEELFSFNAGITYNKQRINFSYDLNSNEPYSLPGSSLFLPIRYYTHLSMDYAYRFNEKNKIYAQLGVRNIFDEFSINNGALLIGAQVGFKFSKTDIDLQAEFRHYQANYNLGYFNPGIAYRNTSDTSHYANTVGRHLYPLRSFFYHFNQWAVFTEYQQLDISGLSCSAKINHQLNKKWGINLELEYIGLAPEDQDFFSYLFYTFDICYSPVKGVKIGGMISNRAMNLDAHYPTLYQLSKPAFSLMLRKYMPQYW